MTTEAEIGRSSAFAGWFARLLKLQSAPDAEIASAGPDLRELEPVLAALPDPVLLIDASARIAVANEPARVRWGAIPGLRLSAVLRHPPLLDAAQASIRDRSVRTVDYVTIAQAEEHFLVHVAPMNWAGNAASLLVFCDRTAQTNAQRMRADFLANASHELRTPLASLTLLIETIAGPARDSAADRERFLDMMQVQADRMRRLIDDLLSLSRIELDEHVPPSDRADLAVVATRWSPTPLAASRGARRGASRLIAAEARHVVGERFQLAQVVQNLIDNAMKYLAEGGEVEIEVGLAERPRRGGGAAGRRWAEAGRIALLTPAAARQSLLCLCARGGCRPRHRPALSAAPGRALLPGRARNGRLSAGGTGLGLAIVKHIVNRHRGGFLVESQPGRGSAFAAYVESGGCED